MRVIKDINNNEVIRSLEKEAFKYYLDNKFNEVFNAGRLNSLLKHLKSPYKSVNDLLNSEIKIENFLKQNVANIEHQENFRKILVNLNSERKNFFGLKDNKNKDSKKSEQPDKLAAPDDKGVVKKTRKRGLFNLSGDKNYQTFVTPGMFAKGEKYEANIFANGTSNEEIISNKQNKEKPFKSNRATRIFQSAESQKLWDDFVEYFNANNIYINDNWQIKNFADAIYDQNYPEAKSSINNICGKKSGIGDEHAKNVKNLLNGILNEEINTTENKVRKPNVVIKSEKMKLNTSGYTKEQILAKIVIGTSSYNQRSAEARNKIAQLGISPWSMNSIFSASAKLPGDKALVFANASLDELYTNGQINTKDLKKLKSIFNEFIAEGATQYQITRR